MKLNYAVLKKFPSFSFTLIGSFFFFQFSNLCGVVYDGGNAVFTPDGKSLLSPVGRRVTIFDLARYGWMRYVVLFPLLI